MKDIVSGKYVMTLGFQMSICKLLYLE